MAAMAAAIPGSIFDVTGNPAPGPADPAVERDAAAARARPHHHRLTAPASATRPDASSRQTRRHCRRNSRPFDAAPDSDPPIRPARTVKSKHHMWRPYRPFRCKAVSRLKTFHSQHSSRLISCCEFPVDPARWWPQVTSGGVPAPGATARDVELAESSEDVIDWLLVHQTGSYWRRMRRVVGRRGSGRGGTGCFAVPGRQGVGQPFEVRHGHGERRVATSAKR